MGVASIFGGVLHASTHSVSWESSVNLALWANMRAIRWHFSQQAYAPDPDGARDSATVTAIKKRAAHMAINGLITVYNWGWYPPVSTGAWQTKANDNDAYTSYSTSGSGGDFRDAVPPSGSGNPAVTTGRQCWQAGLTCDFECIDLIRAEYVAQGLDPDVYVWLIGPNEPGAKALNGTWNFHIGFYTFVDWVNFQLPQIRARYPNAYLGTPVMAGFFGKTDVGQETAALVAVLSTAGSLGFDFAENGAQYQDNFYLSRQSCVDASPARIAAMVGEKWEGGRKQVVLNGWPCDQAGHNEFGQNPVTGGWTTNGRVFVDAQLGLQIRAWCDAMGALPCHHHLFYVLDHSGAAEEDGGDTDAAAHGLVRWDAANLKRGQWFRRAYDLIRAGGNAPPANGFSAHASYKAVDHALLVARSLNSAATSPPVGYLAEAGAEGPV